MPDERLEVSVTFDERGYIGSAPELLSPVVRSMTNGLPSRTNVCTRRKRTCGPQGGSPGLNPLRSFTPDNIDSVRSMGHQRAPSVPFAIKNKIAD